MMPFLKRGTNTNLLKKMQEIYTRSNSVNTKGIDIYVEPSVMQLLPCHEQIRKSYLKIWFCSEFVTAP